MVSDQINRAEWGLAERSAAGGVDLLCRASGLLEPVSADGAKLRWSFGMALVVIPTYLARPLRQTYAEIIL